MEKLSRGVFQLDPEYREKVKNMINLANFNGMRFNRSKRRYTYNDIQSYITEYELPEYCQTPGQKKHFKDCCKQFVVERGKLFYMYQSIKTEKSYSKVPVIFNPDEQLDILCFLHFGERADEHKPRLEISEKLEANYYWFFMLDDLRFFLRCCRVCCNPRNPNLSFKQNNDKESTTSKPQSVAIDFANFKNPRGMSNIRNLNNDLSITGRGSENFTPLRTRFLNTLTGRVIPSNPTGGSCQGIRSYNLMSGRNQELPQFENRPYAPGTVFPKNHGDHQRMRMIGPYTNSDPGSMQYVYNIPDSKTFRLAYEEICKQVSDLEKEFVNATNGRISSQNVVIKCIKHWSQLNTFTLSRYARSIIDELEKTPK